MSKQIKLNYKNEVNIEKTYTLEYTRKSAEIMERSGFNYTDISDKPVSTIPMLFHGAFLANHKNITRDIADKIFDEIPNKSDLTSALLSMYMDCIRTLTNDKESGDDESEEDIEKNVSWGKNF